MNTRRKIISQMGFIRDQEGIMNRYLREKPHWAKHLGKTRDFINKSFCERSIDSVAILGSGWLLDVPLAEMKDRYKHIFLVDIHHPPQIRKKVESLDNVELIEADLSGGAIEQLWGLFRKKGSTDNDNRLREINLTPPLSHIRPDAIVSVNLLNQLDIILMEFLEKKHDFHESSIKRFRSDIQAFHLEWITEIPGCLVTDTLEINTDPSGKESVKSLLYADLPEAFRSDRWSWEFDTHGYYHHRSLTRMEVQAIEWN